MSGSTTESVLGSAGDRLSFIDEELYSMLLHFANGYKILGRMIVNLLSAFQIYCASDLSSAFAKINHLLSLARSASTHGITDLHGLLTDPSPRQHLLRACHANLPFLVLGYIILVTSLIVYTTETHRPKKGTLKREVEESIAINSRMMGVLTGLWILSFCRSRHFFGPLIRIIAILTRIDEEALTWALLLYRWVGWLAIIAVFGDIEEGAREWVEDRNDPAYHQTRGALAWARGEAAAVAWEDYKTQLAQQFVLAHSGANEDAKKDRRDLVSRMV